MKDWVWRHRKVTSIGDFPNNVIGFVYQITYDKGLYIGKKNLWSWRTFKALLSGKERKGHVEFFNILRNHKKVRMERLKLESDWQSYTGSPKTSMELEVRSRKILYLAKSELELSYLEAKAIFEADAIRNDRYINRNVLGKFYADKLP